MPSVGTSLLILGERKALAWVLRTDQMAFSRHRAKLANQLAPGDRLLLYCSRGCFHSPRRDRGLIFGEATVLGTPRESEVEVAGAMFQLVMPIKVDALAPFRGGLELSPLVPELEVFPDVASWSARMRTPLVALSESDTALLRRHVAPLLREPRTVRQQYLDRAIGDRERRSMESAVGPLHPPDPRPPAWPGAVRRSHESTN